MPLTLKTSGNVLALASRSMVRPTQPARWLVRMRWGAIVGMLTTIAVADRMVPSLRSGTLYTGVLCLAAVNLAWMLAVGRMEDGAQATVTPQITLDVVFLTALLWVSGGVSNPFACFLAFQIVMAGLLARPATMLTIAGVATACAVVLIWAPPLDLSQSTWGEQNTRLAAEVVALSALSLFTGFFVFIFAQRLEAFRDQVARNDKLAALGRTLGAMSHELNTPLGTIHLAARELTLIGQEMSNAEVERLGQTVVEEAARASDVIALLRGYVQPDAHGEWMDVCAFVPAWANRELDRLHYAGERVVRTGPATEAWVIRAALCQVLSNVLRNASEALHAGAHPRLEVDVVPLPHAVEVRVRDSGPGIATQLLATLGEPFQTTKADQGGTGLGLYVSTLLAERMGGALALESAPGQGTRVTLTLRRR